MEKLDCNLFCKQTFFKGCIENRHHQIKFTVFGKWRYAFFILSLNLLCAYTHKGLFVYPFVYLEIIFLFKLVLRFPLHPKITKILCISFVFCVYNAIFSNKKISVLLCSIRFFCLIKIIIHN